MVIILSFWRPLQRGTRRGRVIWIRVGNQHHFTRRGMAGFAHIHRFRRMLSKQGDIAPCFSA